jgi:DNA-binding CsgD family transcriptional regulator
MIRSIVTYGSSIALAAFTLRWLEYRHAIRMFPTELYVILVAALFTAVGIWVGRRLTRPTGSVPFARNERALQALGISEREYEVLCLLAAGHSNREIAERLFVSTNTVKTHLAHLYEKLGVSRRTQAIHKCKALRLIA